jgi:hypothetical protein
MNETKFKVGDKVSFIGYDGLTSIDTIFDVWEAKDGQCIELSQNEIVLNPEMQIKVNLKKR